MKSVAAIPFREISRPASAHLDFIRAAAACAVMFGHVRALFFVEYPQIVSPNFFLKVLYFLTGFGHQAVIVFFVLSGFLISSSVFKSLGSQKWSGTEYAIHRSARLYVVLIPGLLLGLLWDFVGSHFLPGRILYSHPLASLGPAIARENLTIGNFFGNLFYLQTILCSTFGSNGPLWSLANEFWYYVLFPLGLFAGIALAKRAWRQAIVLGLLACGVSYFLGFEKLTGFVIWLAGSVLVIAYAKLSPKPSSTLMLYLVASSLTLAACLSAARVGMLPALTSDLVVAMAFTLFLFGALGLPWGANRQFYLRTTHSLAAFSYSLYVLHFPLVLFLRAWIAPGTRWQPDLLHLACAGGLAAIALAFAWGVSQFTENKTQVARNWLRRAASAVS